MFLIRWVRALVALPFAVLGTALAMLNIQLDAAVLQLAWQIGHSERIGQLALGRVYARQGPEVAKAVAHQWMLGHPSPGIAAMAGVYAMSNGEVEAGRSFLVRGQQLGDDPSGTLDQLELMVADAADDPKTRADVLNRFESRRDLTPMTSKTIIIHHLWTDMLAGRFNEAEVRAEHALQVDDLLDAEMVLWALATRGGDEATAQRHLERAKGPEASKAYAQALCNVAIGRLDEARLAVGALAEMSPGGAEQIERIIAEKARRS